MSVIAVQAGAIGLLREGLIDQIALSAQQIAQADELAGSRERPELYRRPLRQIDALRALIEQIGWEGEPAEEAVDLAIHGWALTQAICSQATAIADMLAEVEHDDQTRREQNLAPQLPNLLRDGMALSDLAREILREL